MTTVNRGWGTAEQNAALRVLDELVAILVDMEPDVRDAIRRNRYSPGIKRHTPGELGEMEGTPAPTYRGKHGPNLPRDPTGEDAVWAEEIDDPVHSTVVEMLTLLIHVRNKARWLKAQKAPCAACGKSIEGRAIVGYCRRCYDRWVYLGRPDRDEFEEDQRERFSNSSTRTSKPSDLKSSVETLFLDSKSDDSSSDEP